MKPGVYFGLSADEYHAAEAVGSSALRDMLISPLDCWSRHVDPDRVDGTDDTDASIRGEAFHAVLLEGMDALKARFYPALDRDAYPQVLWSGDQLAAECGMRLLAKNGTLADRAERLLKDGFPRDRLGPFVAMDHQAAHLRKKELPRKEWDRITLAHDVMESAGIASAFQGGEPEVSIFYKDERTGLLCKARIDYLKPASFLDVKSFSNKSGKHVETAVAHAFIYSRHHIQGRHYCEAIDAAKRHQLPAHGGALNWNGDKPHDCFFVYIQAGFAPNVVVRRFAPRSPGGYVNAYWKTAEMERRRALDEYARCLKQYGRGAPWADPVIIKDWSDEDFPFFTLEGEA